MNSWYWRYLYGAKIFHGTSSMLALYLWEDFQRVGKFPNPFWKVFNLFSRRRECIQGVEVDIGPSGSRGGAQNTQIPKINQTTHISKWLLYYYNAMRKITKHHFWKQNIWTYKIKFVLYSHFAYNFVSVNFLVRN